MWLATLAMEPPTPSTLCFQTLKIFIRHVFLPNPLALRLITPLAVSTLLSVQYFKLKVMLIPQSHFNPSYLAMFSQTDHKNRCSLLCCRSFWTWNLNNAVMAKSCTKSGRRIGYDSLVTQTESWCYSQVSPRSVCRVLRNSSESVRLSWTPSSSVHSGWVESGSHLKRGQLASEKLFQK